MGRRGGIGCVCRKDILAARNVLLSVRNQDHVMPFNILVSSSVLTKDNTSGDLRIPSSTK